MTLIKNVVFLGHKLLIIKFLKQWKNFIHYSDEPSIEGVKQCANYMYESLSQSNFDSVICVVLTGMGADGTKGII